MEKFFKKPKDNIEILWASTREVINIFQAEEINCHIITVPGDLLGKLNNLNKDLENFSKETDSNTAKIILENYEKELLNFKQVCPIEMLDKLDNPITLKSAVKKVS